jgi:hypothetical protein
MPRFFHRFSYQGETYSSHPVKGVTRKKPTQDTSNSTLSSAQSFGNETNPLQPVNRTSKYSDPDYWSKRYGSSLYKWHCEKDWKSKVGKRWWYEAIRSLHMMNARASSFLLVTSVVVMYRSTVVMPMLMRWDRMQQRTTLHRSKPYFDGQSMWKTPLPSSENSDEVHL